MLCFQLPLEEKIEKIAKSIYGADGIELSEEAKKRMDLFKKQVRGNVLSIAHLTFLMSF